MGGRGGSGGGGKISFQEAVALGKRDKQLNSQIARLKSNIAIVEGTNPNNRFIGVTESGRKRYASVHKSYESDKKRLSTLEKEKADIAKKLKRYQRGR